MGAEDGDPVTRDLLEDAEWWCTGTAPGTWSGPQDLDDTFDWLAAPVPGTVAAALRAVGAEDPPVARLDGQDWWYRCRVAGPTEPAGGASWLLESDGLATLADVWWNGRHVVSSDSMFAPSRVTVDAPGAQNELCIRFAALTPVLDERRPRPRWKSTGVTSQNLRWLRTTLLGRQAGWASVPAPVGPWRPVRLRPAAPVEVVRRSVRALCPSGVGPTSGTVAVSLVVSGPDPAPGSPPPEAALVVAGTRTGLVASPDGAGWRLTGTAAVGPVDRWWPHTHGDQPRYPVRAEIAGVTVDLGEVGFRTVEADRSDDGFGLVVNGVPVFCRGACWYPVDPVGLQTTDAELSSSMRQVRAAGVNLLRIPGGTVYETERFFDACDRAGVLVWQDAMLGPVDPPSDEGFLATVDAEVTTVLDAAAGHPSLAVLCGGEEVEEQPAMFGLPRDRWPSPVVERVLPETVGREAPGLVYVTSSPSGGTLPFQSDAGVCHYYGVGIYRFPLGDLRRAAPRFVTEGLAFAVPPDRATVAEVFDGDPSGRHGPAWARAVHRDAGSWLDLEDVRDHYVASLFGVDPGTLWRTDPSRALDLGRAAMAEVAAAAVAEWRRPGSSCAGMVVIGWRDLRPGPGWGLVDACGRPKAPWYVLARGWAPLAVLCTDEGVNGVDVHVANDTGTDVEAVLLLGLHTAAHTVETASCPVRVPARSGATVRAESLFDGFRDLNYAYRFGDRTYDLVTVDLVDPSGAVRAHTSFLPGGPVREPEPDVGLQARVESADGGAWLLHVSTNRFAQYVQVDVPGFAASDSWFHLPPHGGRTVRLDPEPGVVTEPSGWVRALNSPTAGRVAR
jgi:beta-mannosidase